MVFGILLWRGSKAILKIGLNLSSLGPINFKLVGRCTVDNPFVSDHLAVHSLLDLAKLQLERKRDKTDKK